MLQNLFDWIPLHPVLAGLVVFLCALLESLAIVGMLVPGVVIMFGFGALIGVGVLDFWATAVWSVAGAVAGDVLSYWLGYRYRDRLRDVRPFRTHAEWLGRGEAFFRGNGGKSVILGRLMGPTRAVIPVVAGMMGMRPLSFSVANLFSALIWAPLYLAPGIVFGTALGLAGQVAERLALLLILLLVSAWVITWFVRTSYHLIQPHAVQWTAKTLQWGTSHRYLPWLVRDLFDPERPISRALLVWFVVLIMGVWLFLGILEDVITGDPLVLAGRSLYELLQWLRTPMGDRIMVVFSELGDEVVILPIVLGVLLWMFWRRAWREARYWLAAVGFAALAVVVFKYALQIPRPVSFYSGVIDYSFPSGHATMSMVVYVYLAMLSAQFLSLRMRWLPYAVAALLITGIGFSRLYLGAHWLADVAGGYSFGLAWISLLAITRRHHQRHAENIRGVGLITVLIFAAAGTWHIQNSIQSDLERFAVHRPVERVAVQAWWQREWQELPAYRIDLEGEQEQPLNLQWAGELQDIQHYLESREWHAPLALTFRTGLNFLMPDPSLDQLPVLPKLHNGRQEALILVNKSIDEGQQLILRLWPADIFLQPGNRPLWICSITWLQVLQLPLVSFPSSMDGYDKALMALLPDLTDIEWKQVGVQSLIKNEESQWKGYILLIR